MASPRVGEALYQDTQAIALDGERVSVYGNSVNCLTPGESFEDTLNGQTQVFRTSTALALLISATTGTVPTLWNPSTSGKIFIPKKLILTYLSGTTTIGGVCLAKTITQPGTAVIATNGPIITFTEGVAELDKFNGGLAQPNAKTSAMKWAPAVCTFVAAPVKCLDTSISLGAAAPSIGNNLVHKFDGECIVWPGSALSVVYTVTTSTALFFVTLIGVEKQLPVMR